MFYFLKSVHVHVCVSTHRDRGQSPLVLEGMGSALFSRGY